MDAKYVYIGALIDPCCMLSYYCVLRFNAINVIPGIELHIQCEIRLADTSSNTLPIVTWTKHDSPRGCVNQIKCLVFSEVSKIEETIAIVAE